jgi:hypothetical protein
MTKSEETLAIARQVEQAFSSGRLPDDALYAPNATGWHNTDEIEVAHGSAHERWALVRSLFPDFHAEDTHVHAWDGGFAFQYVFVGNGPNGAKIRIPGCIVATLGKGGITRMQEYVDSAHATPIVEALRAKGLMD